jgi:hypothetical protein
MNSKYLIFIFLSNSISKRFSKLNLRDIFRDLKTLIMYLSDLLMKRIKSP